MAGDGRNPMAYFLQNRKIGLLLIRMFYLYYSDKINDKVPPNESVYGQLTTVIIQFLGFAYHSRIFFLSPEQYYE